MMELFQMDKIRLWFGLKEMDSHLAEDVGLQLSGPETIRRGVIKKEGPSQRERKKNQSFLWI